MMMMKSQTLTSLFGVGGLVEQELGGCEITAAPSPSPFTTPLSVVPLPDAAVSASLVSTVSGLTAFPTTPPFTKDSNIETFNWYNYHSVLWRCWLGGRKGIRPVKNSVVGCWHGYLSGARCRLAYMAQLMPLPLTVSCFSKIQIGFALLVPAHLGSSGKGLLKGRVCVYHSKVQQIKGQLNGIHDGLIRYSVLHSGR